MLNETFIGRETYAAVPAANGHVRMLLHMQIITVEAEKQFVTFRADECFGTTEWNQWTFITGILLQSIRERISVLGRG